MKKKQHLHLNFKYKAKILNSHQKQIRVEERGENSGGPKGCTTFYWDLTSEMCIIESSLTSSKKKGSFMSGFVLFQNIFC